MRGFYVEEKKYIVYVHLFPNGKRYFGITCKRPESRWEKGKGYFKKNMQNTPMYNAILKYGWENILHIILHKDLSKDEAIEKERYYIAKYKTNIHRHGNEFGYNLTDGGEGAEGHKISEEKRKQWSKRQKGKGKGKDCYRSIPVFYNGKYYESITHLSEEIGVARHNLEAWLNGVHACPIEVFEKGLRFVDKPNVIFPQEKAHSFLTEFEGKIFKSQAELARYLNVSPPTICNWLQGKTPIPKEFLERGLKPNKNIELKESNYVNRYKVIFDGKEYNSQAEFAKTFNLDRTTVTNWFLGKTKIPEEYIKKGLKRIKYLT